MRFTISCLALAVLVVAARSAHAFSALGSIGYGHTFRPAGDDNFGPTLEIGGSFGVPLVAIDVTYWNVLDSASDASELRIGARLDPPLVPLYARIAAGIPLDGGVRDAQGADVIFGAGWTAFSLVLLKLNIELDYHYWTAGLDAQPFEIKAGVVVGF